MTENEIGKIVIGCAMNVHTALGPGLLERAYELCMIHELERQQLVVRRQVPVTLRYRELLVEDGFRIDLLVQERVVLELKALEAILPVHRGQLLSYLRLGGYKLGYLLNFNVAHMSDGITRMVNGL